MHYIMLFLIICFAVSVPVSGHSPDSGAEKFHQLTRELPSPNVYRTAAGAPGPFYWQQQADYDIKVSLDEKQKRIVGSEVITYLNNSPSEMHYVWLQLDQNQLKSSSIANRSALAEQKDGVDILTYTELIRSQSSKEHGYGDQITSVVDAKGKPLPYSIVDTMMRIDLPKPLKSGEQMSYTIKWHYNIPDIDKVDSKNGFEYFPESDTYIYSMAQWFPRMAAYTDYAGWQHKAFLGAGEFTLEFGNYHVEITVPSDHVVSATGVLQNPKAVLSKTQRNRLQKAHLSDKPVFIITPAEAEKNENEKALGTKTWVFNAEMVRDFAWSSSRKFIWDAMPHKQDDKDVPIVMAMSFYPNEAKLLWSKYSTQAIIHTLGVYSHFTFPFPYPVMQSVNSWKESGMEYPMITFNGHRPVKNDKTGEWTYSRRDRNRLIMIVIHEVGHNYFPMTVNSDERQWTWMDEGINTFLQYSAHQLWEEGFLGFRNKQDPAELIVDYVQSDDQVPIMSQSDSLLDFGLNSYIKPTVALSVLRETVMGRDLFDHAFREYSRRWKYKRPAPADFFRTMEDASGMDLDWFWQGWFFSTDHVDVAVTDVREYQISSQNPDIEYPLQKRKQEKDRPEFLPQKRNRENGLKTLITQKPSLSDFYSENDKFTVSNKDRNAYMDFMEGLKAAERKAFLRTLSEGSFVYFIDFNNIGGLVSPLPLMFYNKDGTTDTYMVPVEVWRRNPRKVTKLFIRKKKLASIELDEYRQTSDVNHSNNNFPKKILSSRIELHKDDDEIKNLMADMHEKLKVKGEASAEIVPLVQDK